MGELLACRTWIRQFNQLYFVSKLSVRWTSNMVRTVRRTMLHILNWLISEMQASVRTLLCRLYTDMHAHAHTRHLKPFIHLQPKALAMVAMAVPRDHLFITLYLLGPTDKADPPTSPQMRPFPLKREAGNIQAVSHVLLSHFSPLL